ncbi:MAG: hypothetical protein ABIJ61_13370 [bacterium]
MSAREVAAVGVFAALAYAGSFALLIFPNVTLSILLVFFAGYLIGKRGGLFVGVVSALLISLFNPYGLAFLPILIAQVAAYALIGFVGGMCSSSAAALPNWRYPALIAVVALGLAFLLKLWFLLVFVPAIVSLLIFRRSAAVGALWLGLLGLLTALLYQVPVSVVDAWVFQPFWARLGTAIPFALITIVSNVIFFIFLFPVLAKLKELAIFQPE